MFDFVNKIADATEASSVKWHSVSTSGQTFTCSSGAYELFITRRYNDDLGERDYEFAIAGKAEADFQVDSGYDDHFRIMKNLFSAVQINAGGLSNINDEFFHPPEALT